MKTIAFLLLLAAPAVFAQGPLTPPGAPAPTMKTLSQIETRTPISSLPFTINQPGSYYVTGNLTVATGDGITINANDVSLDLCGYTLKSNAPSATGTAIQIGGGRTNIRISNGALAGGCTSSGSAVTTGPGFSSGIYLSGSPNDKPNVVVSDFRVHGLAGHGINLRYPGTSIERCIVTVCGGVGLDACSVTSCQAVDCTDTAIRGDLVSHCKANSFNGIGIDAKMATDSQGSSDGVTGLNADIVTNCKGTSYSGYGLGARTATNCIGTSIEGIGLSATSATNCYGTSSDEIGFYVETATNCYGTSQNGFMGMQILGTGSFCRGSRTGGTAISGGVLIGCTTSGGTISSPSKHLGTP